MDFPEDTGGSCSPPPHESTVQYSLLKRDYVYLYCRTVLYRNSETAANSSLHVHTKTVKRVGVRND